MAFPADVRHRRYEKIEGWNEKKGLTGVWGFWLIGMPYLGNILEEISIGKGSEFLEIQIAFVNFAGREVVEWGKRVEVGGVCC